jgi:uncharacterized protein (DUF2147 family)
MKTTRLLPFRLALAALALALATPYALSQPTQATDPRGRWITANGNLEVEVAPCGKALCGTVTQVLGNRSMSRDGAAMAPVDGRPALGMKLLHGFVTKAGGQADAPPTEWNGEIYNRENGKTYSCQMSVSTAATAAGELVLHAYVGLPLFGKTQRWQRAPVAASAAAAAH